MSAPVLLLDAAWRIDRVIDTEGRIDRRYAALAQSTQRALDRAGLGQEISCAPSTWRARYK